MSDEGRHGHPLPFAPMCWECWQDTARTLKVQNEALEEALGALLDDTQHVHHVDCGEGPCPVREARRVLEGLQHGSELRR